MKRIALLIALCLGGACADKAKQITQDMTLGGQVIPASLLEEGRIAYMHYCRQCHGEDGNGKGPAAAGYLPAPRDFTKAAFKFGSVENGQLPTDADLMRIVRHGLGGTAMLPWDISERELKAVVQYVKTFKPECPPDRPRDKCLSRWERAKKMPEPLPLPPDPHKNDAAGREAAVKLGKMLYHTRGCNTCHPNYVGAEEYYDLTSAVPDLPRELRQDPYLPIVKEAPPFGTILPPDFTSRVLRSGETVEDIFRTITAGTGPMPTWKNVAENERWALAYYVYSLVQLRHESKALAFWDGIHNLPPFTPPPPPPPPETQPATQPTEGMPGQPAKPGAQPGMQPATPPPGPAKPGQGVKPAGSTKPPKETPTDKPPPEPTDKPPPEPTDKPPPEEPTPQ